MGFQNGFDKEERLQIQSKELQWFFCLNSKLKRILELPNNFRLTVGV